MLLVLPEVKGSSTIQLMHIKQCMETLKEKPEYMKMYTLHHHHQNNKEYIFLERLVLPYIVLDWLVEGLQDSLLSSLEMLKVSLRTK